MDEKARDDYGDDVGQKVYTLTRQGKLWGKGGAIAWSRLRYKYLKAKGKELEGLMALSSTYYTAWGNALARARQNWLLAIFWLPRAIWALCKALRLSDEVVGLKNMTVGQLDIRASILAAAFFRPGHYEDALKCINEALSRSDICTDSLALLKIKLGEIRDRQKADDGGIYFGEAQRMVSVKSDTRVRVLRALGAHMLRRKKSRPVDYKIVAMSFCLEAMGIAKRENLGDQIVKIRALMKKIR
ncbi:MAG: hypothetical protein V1845_02855 [bacterium]